MVFTLHRYIFRDAFKVFVLAALALTLMMSLGSILRPVQEYGIGPRQVVHLMGYFLPITLTFVLPIAALFATALVYGRLASNNELDACRASGISLLTLVYPGLALAIMVATANLILSFHVIPVFVHRAEESFKADAKQILFRNIQRSGYYKPSSDNRYLIYADRADLQNDMLSGVVITEVKGHEIKKITTAESAKVHFIPHKGFNEVQITAYKPCQMTPEGNVVSFEWLPLTMEFGSMLGDDIKFKKIGEMKKIRLDPILFYPVEKLARQICAQFTAELLAQDIATRTANEASGFYELYSGRKFVEFTASRCNARSENEVQLTGEVVVIESDLDSGLRLRTLRSKRALLHIEAEQSEPTITMDIYSPQWQCVDGSEGFSRRQIIRGLIIPEVVQIEFETEDVLGAISPASIASALQKGPSAKLKALQNKLHRKIQETLVEIKAEIHSRLVFGIGCVPMIMIGISLGIILKDGHLLSAFGASSVPAGLLLVCILMGKNIAKNPGAQAGSGIILMWVGLVFLSLLAVLIYRRLLKN